MTPAWAQRQEELLSDCVVSPDVFHHMVDRLGEFVVPYQHALETEAGQRNVHLYLQGLLSHLPRKNAEDIATLVDVERLVIQDFIGTAPWDHRPLVDGVGWPSGRSVGGTRWHHRFRSQQLPQTRHAFGRGEAPMVWPPGQGRQLPGGRVHGVRLSPRPCLARLPLVPS